MGKSWKANIYIKIINKLKKKINKHIKTKIKIYADSMTKNFHYKKMLQEKAPCKFLSIIMLDSVIEENKKYYS